MTWWTLRWSFKRHGDNDDDDDEDDEWMQVSDFEGGVRVEAGARNSQF